MGSTDAPDGPATSTGDMAALKEAFELFSQTSAELSASYESLQLEVKRLNEELASANRRLSSELRQREQLLNLLPGAVLILDDQGQIEEANDTAHQLFGELPPHTRWEALLEATDETDEFLLRAKDVQRRLALTRSARPDGGHILLLADITEARERERERRRRERLSEMGRMSANLAHQLRTPLATALLYLSQLDDRTLDSEERGRYLTRGLSRLRRLEQLVADMLRFVRGSNDHIDTKVPVSALVETLAQTQEPLYRQKNVELHFEPDATIEALPGTLEGWESMLGNLLSNALHFSPVGHTVSLRIGESSPDRIRIDVCDNGPGLTGEAPQRLFEPFFTTRKDGTGLGLAIVRDYMEGLGGTAMAFNRAPGGCCIRLDLPKAGTDLATVSTNFKFENHD